MTETKFISSHPSFCSPYLGEESVRNIVSSFNFSLSFRFVFNQIGTILPLPSLESLLSSPLPLPVSRYRSLARLQAFGKNSPLVSLSLQSILYAGARSCYSKIQTWSKIILAQARGRYGRSFKGASLNLFTWHSQPCRLWFVSTHPREGADLILHTLYYNPCG